MLVSIASAVLQHHTGPPALTLYYLFNVINDQAV